MVQNIKEWSSYVTMHTLSSVPSTSETTERIPRHVWNECANQPGHKNCLAVILNTEQRLLGSFSPLKYQPIYLKFPLDVTLWFGFSSQQVFY